MGRWPGCTEAYRSDVTDEVTAEQASGPAGDRRDQPEAADGRVLVDIDPWSFVALVLAAAFAVAVFAIADQAGDVLTGIGVGVLLGLALTPVVNAAQRRWNTSRGTAVVIVGAGLTVAVAVVVLLVAPAAIRQSREFSEELPTTVREFYSWPIIGPRLEEADAAGSIEEWIEDAPARVDDRTLADLGERLLGGVLSAVVVLVTALGVLVDGEGIVRRFRVLVPVGRLAQADRLGRIVYSTFGSYFAGSMFVAILAGLVTLSTGLLLGVPLAPVAGLWTTFTNLIPQIGGLLGGGFFVLLAVTQGPVIAVIALAVVVAYQNLENHVISPAIVGRAVNLSPPATMLAVLVGGAAAGVPGALVATPLFAASKAVYLDRRGQMPEPEAHVMRSRLSGLRRRLPWRRGTEREGEGRSQPD
jgi:predicted PurR-regulated permease PerM